MPPVKSRARARNRTQPAPLARRAKDPAHVDRQLDKARKSIATARQADRAFDQATGAVLEFLSTMAERRGWAIVTPEQRDEQRRRLDAVTHERDVLLDRVATLERELTAANFIIQTTGGGGQGTPPPGPVTPDPAPPGVVHGLLVDPRAWFFHAIERQENAPAPDWKSVLESLPGRGMGTNPKPGQVQRDDAPWCGITVMIDAGNHARGRIWLPTRDSVLHDGNRWHTREIQVIAEPEPGRMVWAWIDKGGALYTPWPATPAAAPRLALAERAKTCPPNRAAGRDKGV